MSENHVSTPRITAPYLEQYVGQTVILVGRVVELRGEIAMLESDGMVTVALAMDTHLTVGNGVHLIGKVQPDHSLKVLIAGDIGSDVDYTMYQNVVQATHNFKDIFVV